MSEAFVRPQRRRFCDISRLIPFPVLRKALDTAVFGLPLEVVMCLDIADSAGFGSHHNRLRGCSTTVKNHSLQKVTMSYACGGEHDISLGKIFGRIDLIKIRHSHLLCALLFRFVSK